MFNNKNIDLLISPRILKGKHGADIIKRWRAVKNNENK